jgi:hypothetical protein
MIICLKKQFFLSVILTCIAIDGFCDENLNVINHKKPVIGIGQITDNFDSTTASFDFYSYLKDHPIINAGLPLSFDLVDISSEAEYSVSGEINGYIKMIYHDSEDKRYQYIWNRSLTITLRRNGAKATQWTLPFEGRANFHEKDEYFNIRGLINENGWKMLESKIDEYVSREAVR